MLLYDHFYDAQIKRYLQQVIRAFSGYQYQTGRLIDGLPEQRIVPCRSASMNRMVAQLMRNGENSLLTVPMVTVAVTSMRRDQARDRDHSFRETLQVAEREIDPFDRYGPGLGQRYSVERLMPLPFELTFQIDIWTSNMDQKHQLLEQMLTIAGRDFDIQNSDNALDWTALSTMNLTEIQYSSRSIPAGTEEEIDVTTLNYTLPIWLNPPAKITRQERIEEIHTNVDTQIGDGELVPTGEGAFTKTIITPQDYRIEINRGVLTLTDAHSIPTDWPGLEEVYRRYITGGISEVRLRKNGDADGAEIVGTIFRTTDPTKLDWQIDPDTLPSNTLAPINAIVRPLQVSPGNGLPAVSNGQRYLVFDDISTTELWGVVNAHANDIIQYTNGAWTVVTQAAGLTSGRLVNLSTGTQLEWNGESWVKAIDGLYGPGYWRIIF